MINCNQYDYIEIACMYRYPIKITMNTGEVIECTALDTPRNEAREESIKVNTEGTKSIVVLDGIGWYFKARSLCRKPALQSGFLYAIKSHLRMKIKAEFGTR